MAGARCVRAKRSPRQRVQAGRPQSLQFGGSRLCAFGFVPIRGQQEHMPRGAVVVRACSFTENDDIGAVQVCRASRCSSAFWTVGVCRDLFLGRPAKSESHEIVTAAATNAAAAGAWAVNYREGCPQNPRSRCPLPPYRALAAISRSRSQGVPVERGEAWEDHR